MFHFEAVLISLGVDIEKEKKLYHEAIKDNKSHIETKSILLRIKMLQALADVFLQETLS